MEIFGKLLSLQEEIPEKFLLKKNNVNFLIGHGGILPAFKVHPKLYEDRLWTSKIYLDLTDFNKNTLILGSMGSGKSNLMKYLSLVFELRGIKQIIHDVKGEYVELFWNPEVDLLWNIFDERGFFWDFIYDFKRDSNLAYTCLKSMVMTYNQGKDAPFWNEKATEILMELFKKLDYVVINDKVTAQACYEDMKMIFQDMTVNARGETQMSAVGVASPVVRALLQTLWIYANSRSERENYCVEDLFKMKFRKLYLIFIPEFSEMAKILNTGLLVALLLKYLSREDVRDIESFVAFILDEYLSFSMPFELELQTFTLARSKGMCLITGMQYLPIGKNNEERRKILTNSRFYTIAFRVSDVETAKWLAEISGEIEVDYDVIQFSDSMNLQINPLQGGGGINTSLSRVKTHNFRFNDFMSLEKFIAFLSIEDKYKFYIKPIWFDLEEKITKGFMRDEVTYQYAG